MLALLLLISPSIFGQAKQEKNQHYWESRKIPASVTRQFLRNDLQKAETTLLGIVEEHQAKKWMDVQEHFDCMLALVECAHRLQRQELYDLIRTLIVLRENHLTLQTTVNDEAFYSLLLLIQSDSGEWTWGRQQSELHVQDGRNLSRMFNGFKRLAGYHSGLMTKSTTGLCEAVELLSLNNMTSLVNLQFRWELAAFTHDLESVECAIDNYDEIKHIVEGDLYWKSMFQFLYIRSKLLYAKPDKERIKKEIIEFSNIKNTELLSYFCLATTLVEGFNSVVSFGFIPESYSHGDCDLNLVKWEWYFMHFWTVGFYLQQTSPERALGAWVHVESATKRVHGPMGVFATIGNANACVKNGLRQEAVEMLRDFDLSKIEELPNNYATLGFALLMDAVNKGIVGFSLIELLQQMFDASRNCEFPALQSMNKYSESLLCMFESNGDVQECIYELVDSSAVLMTPHKIQLLILASQIDQNTLRTIEALKELQTEEIGVVNQKTILHALHDIYLSLDMYDERSVILDELIELTNQYFPRQGSYERLETEQVVYAPFFDLGFDDIYDDITDFLFRIESHGFANSLLHVDALEMVVRAADDLGKTEEEKKYLKTYNEAILNLFGEKNLRYTKSICNAAASNNLNYREAIDATTHCLSLLTEMPNSSGDIAFYSENLGVAYSNANKMDSALFAFENAIKVGDEYLPQLLNETPLDGRSSFLEERARLLMRSYLSAKLSGSQINYNNRARSLQMALPSLFCGEVQNLSEYREARWASVNALSHSKDKRQMSCEEWGFPEECLDDSILYKNQCVLRASNLEGANYKNLSIDNLNIESTLGETKAVIDVIPYTRNGQHQYDVVLVYNDSGLNLKVLSTFSQENINSLEGMWQSWVENRTLNQSFIQTVSDLILGEAFQLPERIEEVYFLFGGPLAFVNPRVLMSPDGDFLFKSHKCVEVVGFQGIYGDWLADLSSMDKIQAFGGLYYDDTGLPNLPGSNREVEKIAEVGADSRLECEVVTGTLEKATFEEISSPDVLHLSMHGIFTEENNSNTISFGDPYGMLSNCELLYPNSNGHLESISGMELACVDLSCTTLSVLASCNSGAGEFSVYGQHDLARAFFMAGSKFVISSKWEVSDDAAQFFMSKFYDNISHDDNLLSCFNSAIDVTAEHYLISDWGNWTLQMK